MIVITVVVALLYVFLALLTARFVADWVQLLAHDWRPRGNTAMALVAKAAVAPCRVGQAGRSPDESPARVWQRKRGCPGGVSGNPHQGAGRTPWGNTRAG